MLCAVPHREIHDFIFVLVKTLFIIPVPRMSVCLFSLLEAVTNSLKAEMKGIKDHTWFF